PSYTMKFMDHIALLIGTILRWRFLLIIFGEPASLHRTENASVHRLTRQFKLDFYRNLKIVRGTPFQRFSVQEQIVLGGNDYDRALKKLARSLDISPKQLHQQAKRAFRIIAARPRAWLFIPAAVIVRFILRRLFTDIQVRGLPQLANSIKRDTVVLVPMHRSHLDYLLIGQVLYDANLNPPVIAAGINLSFWPAGWIIRTLGGYFVKRNAKQDRLHGLVLRRYVNYLVKRGHLQEFFIEGGRSRSGRMRPPKLGLLKTMVNAYIRRVRKDVIFVPVSISYEHVIEDSEYAKENTGSAKTEENLISLFRARGMLRQKYKEVIIHFGEGLRFSEYQQEFQSRGKSKQLIEELALKLCRRIEGQSNIGLRSLTYFALFLSSTYGLERTQLTNWIRRLTEAAEWYREMEEHPNDALPTPALQRFIDQEFGRSPEAESQPPGTPEHHALQYTHDFYSGGVTARTHYLGKEFLFIPGNLRYTADFYRNSIAHVYLTLGMLSLLDARGEPLKRERLKPFHELLRHELLLPTWTEYEEKVDRYLAILEREEIVTSEPKGTLLSEKGFSEKGKAYRIPALLLSPLECLFWVYRLFESERYVERPDPHQPGTIRRLYDYPLFLKNAQQQLSVAKYHGQFTRTEISSLAIITGCLEGLAARGVITFQEQYGKKANIILENLPEEEMRLLRETHRALLKAVRLQTEEINRIQS
ncbi:1-acyl-sn-glycerol-3-phosphate acyltransferase, partial [bacterium]|nr:1-acyl-sn-glycerol-3-phosphate acyltransferase [bacterium]